MNIITQEAKKRQAAVKFAMKKWKSTASRRYGVGAVMRISKKK